jgi:hypothetical protein
MPDEGAPWQYFAGALFAMGLLFFVAPDAAPWLGLALVLGALYAAQQAAEAQGVNGPLVDLGLLAAKGK